MGVVLAIEELADYEELNYKVNRGQEIEEKLIKHGFFVGCALILTLLIYYSWINDSHLSFFPKILMLFVNITGCFISYILVLQEKQQSNRMIRKFCTLGTYIDCNQVTKSRFSKLFGIISWAEIGLAYFSAVFLWIAIAPISNGWIVPLWWISLLTLPFTLCSLIVQAFFIRKWCLYCCTIVLLLWVNVGINNYYFDFVDILPVFESALLALLILMCIVLVLKVFKMKSHDEVYSEQRESARIKYDIKTLQGQLSEYRNETNAIGLTWKNSRSMYEITIYLSIACSHCGKAIKEFRRLTEIYSGIDFRIIFSVTLNPQLFY